MNRGSRARESEYIRDERRSRTSESLLESRVYISGINVKNTSYRDIDSWMSEYGKVLDVVFFDRHILVQFERESDATKAVDREQGQIYRGSRFDIRFAHSSDGSMNRSDISHSKSPRNSSYDRDPRDVSPRREHERERSPEDKDRYYKERHQNSSDYRNYDRPKSVADDRPSNPVIERPRNIMEERARSNNRQELMNNDIKDSNWDAPPAVNKVPLERPNFEAAIVVMSSDLLNYAETIESKFQRQIALSTHIIVLKEEAHANACIDDLERKGVLYAILVNHTNESHSSCTLRILHGSGQEHRNMLLTNALSFVARNYEDYQKQHKELKSIAPKPNYDPSRMPPGFMPPDDKVIYQLHLLADSRMLTMDELNEVDDFIQKRLQVLNEAEGVVQKPMAMSKMPSKEMMPSNALMRGGDDGALSYGHQSVGLGGVKHQPQSMLLHSMGRDNEHSAPMMGGGGGGGMDPYGGGYGEAPQGTMHDNMKVKQALDNLMQSNFRVGGSGGNVAPDQHQQQMAMDDGGYGGPQQQQQFMGRPPTTFMANQSMRPGLQTSNPYANNYPAATYPQAPMYRARAQFPPSRPTYPGY